MHAGVDGHPMSARPGGPTKLAEATDQARQARDARPGELRLVHAMLVVNHPPSSTHLGDFGGVRAGGDYDPRALGHHNILSGMGRRRAGRLGHHDNSTGLRQDGSYAGTGTRRS